MLKKSASGVPASLRGAMYHTNTPQNIVNYGWTISILLLPECTNMYHETGPGLGHSRFFTILAVGYNGERGGREQ